MISLHIRIQNLRNFMSSNNTFRNCADFRCVDIRYITKTLHSEGIKYRRELYNSNSIKITRKVIYRNTTKVEIYEFCDTLQQTYGACIYMQNESTISVYLLTEKSKEALIKEFSMPSYNNVKF